jgi:hypothetical protein
MDARRRGTTTGCTKWRSTCMRVLGNASDGANGLTICRISTKARQASPHQQHLYLYITSPRRIYAARRTRQTMHCIPPRRIEGLLKQVQYDKVQDMLACHTRKLAFLRDREKEFMQKGRHIIRERTREAEERREAAMRKHGVLDEPMMGTVDLRTQERRTSITYLQYSSLSV